MLLFAVAVETGSSRSVAVDTLAFLQFFAGFIEDEVSLELLLFLLFLLLFIMVN